MTGWHRGRLVAFDLETTGVDVETARIVTAAVVRIDVAARTSHPTEWLVDPGIEIPAEASAIHGVTTERARAEGVDPRVAVAEIHHVLTDAWAVGYPVVAFNASYDLTVLDRELARYRMGGVTPGPVVDPMVLDRICDKYRKGGRKLVDCCRHYEVRLDGAHNSTADAIAAARLAWRMAETYPKVGGSTLDELQVVPQVGPEQWAVGFRAYLEKQGKPSGDVDGSWPLRRALAGAGVGR